MPAASQSVWSRLSTHGVVVLCVFALLAGSLEIDATRAATELGNQISSSRRSQSYFESAMLAADAAVAGIMSQMRITKRALKQANRAIKRNKRAHWNTTAIVQQRSARLAELEARYAGVPPESIPQGFPDRLRGVRRDVARAKAHRQDVGRTWRAALRARSARQYRLNVLKRSLRPAVARRESAEGGLGAYIVQLTRLAAQRAEIQSDAQLSVSSVGFTWPSVGRISQTYGCTGFRLEPARGSCRHFHDGLDIVSGYGSRIHAAADGVVAYAGWNPWDEEGRAWIMVVSHPDGYVTRYGHLIPGSLAGVGQFVRQGEAIGKMGSTGNSTGTHLHFELLQDDITVNPWAYLPAGMVTLKPAKERGRHDKGKHKRGGRGGRAKARDGQRRAGSSGADGDLAPAAIDAPPNGQVFGVDLASVPAIPSVSAAPTVSCPDSSGASGGKHGRARSGSDRHDGKGSAERHRAKGRKGGQGGAARAGDRARSRGGGSADDACVRPTALRAAPSGAMAGSAGAAAEDSAGATVRGRVERRVPDTGPTTGPQRGVPVGRRGTSPAPT